MAMWRFIAGAVAGLAGLASFGAPTASGQDEATTSSISLVDHPTTDAQNPHYSCNRPPLAPNPLLKLPLGAIEPRGWLRSQLLLVRGGMTGRLPEVSHWVQEQGNAWLSPTGEGANGWEEAPYWLRGYGDLGYVLQDEAITAAARRWVEGVLRSQREDGYFGPEDNRRGGPENMQLGQPGRLQAPDLWPHMPMLNVLQSCYEATGDGRVLAAMGGYFRWQAALPEGQLLPASWQKIRGGDNLESVLWLYNRTGESWLLDLARRLHAATAPWKDGIASWHGVNICQGFREPAIYAQLSRDPAERDAAERNYREVMDKYGQVPGGMFGADEFARPGFSDPRQMAETCSMVEFMRSFELLGMASGDPIWADRCEEVAFNSLPAAFTPDYRGLRYLTGVNMAQADAASKAPGICNEGQMVSFDPGEAYRCCQHNHAMGWPYFAEHLWMGTRDMGVAAFLYAPCEVRAWAGPRGILRLGVETDYPFDGGIAVSVLEAPGGTFPIYLRVPGWVASGSVASPAGDLALKPEAAGRYVRLEHLWRAGDRILIRFDTPTRVHRWERNKNAASIARGPLWFSLRIAERYIRRGGTEPWPSFDVLPSTPWNYALVLDDPAAVRVATGILPPNPFAGEETPLRLSVRAKRVPQWGLEANGLTMPVPGSPVATSEPEERVTLIPMGAARLRIAAFPVAAGQGEAPK
jgi:hypothetical protein